jgi:hypothetical protein
MLAELFMLKLEAIARSSNPQGNTSSDSRFVPIKLPAAATKGTRPSSTKSA